MQPKLLKVLEEGRFRRLGDVRDREVDVRLVAATHQDLSEAVREKRFRSDLFFRISALPLVIPPLRERPEDVAALAQTLLAAHRGDLGRAELSLAPEAVAALQALRWPGNTRELRNVLERAAILSRGRMSWSPRDLRFSAFAGRRLALRRLAAHPGGGGAPAHRAGARRGGRPRRAGGPPARRPAQLALRADQAPGHHRPQGIATTSAAGRSADRDGATSSRSGTSASPRRPRPSRR